MNTKILQTHVRLVVVLRGPVCQFRGLVNIVDRCTSPTPDGPHVRRLCTNIPYQLNPRSWVPHEDP
jgi:hypothetical protein